MQDNELQPEYGISLNSSPCTDFLGAEMERSDSQGSEYGSLMGEMSASYTEDKDSDMNLFDKPLDMDDFSMDIRGEFYQYQQLGSDLKLGNGDENTGESADDGQDGLHLYAGPKSKKMKVKNCDTQKAKLDNHQDQKGSPSPGKTAVNSREKKGSKNSRRVTKSRPRKNSRPVKTTSVPTSDNEGGSHDEGTDVSLLTNGSPVSASLESVGDFVQIQPENNANDETPQNVVVRMEPVLNMHDELSLENVQAIRNEFSDLHQDPMTSAVGQCVYAADAAVSSNDYLDTNSQSPITRPALTAVPSPSTSTDALASTSTSNMLLTSTSDLVNATGSTDKPIIFNANVLNQGTERNVSYVMIPVSLVPQVQPASTATASTAAITPAPAGRPQIVQLLNDNNGYVCHVCRYSGKMPYLLENHMKTCHLPHRPYVCLGCYKAFNLRGTALCHIRLKHLEAGTQMMIDQDMEGLQTVECQKLMQLIFRCHVCDSVGKYMSGVNNKPKNLNPHLFVCKSHAEVAPSATTVAVN